MERSVESLYGLNMIRHTEGEGFKLIIGEDGNGSPVRSDHRCILAAPLIGLRKMHRVLFLRTSGPVLYLHGSVRAFYRRRSPEYVYVFMEEYGGWVNVRDTSDTTNIPRCINFFKETLARLNK